MKRFVSYLTILCVLCGPSVAADWDAQSAEDAKQDRTALIFDGKSPDKLACDTTLRAMPDGSWAMVMLGGDDAEPRPRNGVFITRSTDQGRTWSPMDPVDLGFKREGDTAALVPSESMVLDGRCTLFFATHDGRFAGWREWMAHSADSCRTWSPPEPAPGRLHERTFIRNHIVTRDGRVILPFQHYLDAPSCRNPRNGVLISSDRGKTWSEHGDVRLSDNDRYTGWAENNIAELADGRIAMIIRADRLGGVLYYAESPDGGRTWPDFARKTDIPNPGSKATLYPLGGDTVAMLHNPNPSHRSPLALWISFDGLKTWPYRRVLVPESSDGPKGRLNYPDGFVSQDRQFIHFAFDDNRHRAVYVGAKLPPLPEAPGAQPKAATAGPDPSRRMIDFTDPTYGGRIRQIFNSSGDEHDLYHYRSVFNADNSRMLGIETPKGSKEYIVTLYDGDGRFLRKLFTAAEYDWRAAWDRRDPRCFYTWKGSTVYRYDAEAGKAEALRSFDNPGVAGPSGLSLNETGDRLLLRMTDKTIRTYRLPELDDERICVIEIPEDWYANWDKLRFTGHQDFFALTFEQKRPLPEGARFEPPFTRIYDGVTGKLFHTHEAVTVGHHDFSPDGKLAYVEGFNQGREMKVRVVNLDGTDDRVVFTAPREKLRYVRNYHITWPAGVSEWFLLSFFPQTGRLPTSYEPWLDEIVQVFVDGKHKVLARTGTTCGDNFWAQPQQSPSADGSRVLFHSNGTSTVGRLGVESSGTIDQCILYLK